METTKLVKMIGRAFDFEPYEGRVHWDPHLADEDLLDLLPEAMAALLTANDRAYAAQVVDFLDAVRVGASPKEREANELLRRMKQDDFSEFARAECEAVAAWLQHVREWPELTPLRPAIDASIADWRRRASKAQY